MTIGCIYCAYNMADLVPASLTPWVEVKRAPFEGHTFKICAISVPFEGFDHGGAPEDATRAQLGAAVHCGDIDHAIVRDKPMKETDARGAALRWLIGAGCDTVIMADADEVWTAEQITAAFAFVEANPWVVWFRVPYKQIVFTAAQWLEEPFTPPRIHRVHIPGGYRAAGFWDDNGVYYQRPWEQESGGSRVEIVQDTVLACLVVPQSAVWVHHATWLSDERSKAKVAYQRRRWGQCSFRWNEETDQLEWDEAYHAQRGLSFPPVVLSDSTTPTGV